MATIGIEPFWYDESFTSLVAELPFADMLQAIAGDTHPPLWYFLSWLIAQVAGTSPIPLRVPAALFSALCSVELFRVVKRYVGKREAMLASGLLAVLPAQVYYGQEARMYSLLTLLVLFTINAISARRWLRVALAGVLLMYTHNMAVLYAVPLGAWALFKSRGRLARYWYLGLAYLPWLGVLRNQLGHLQNNGFWIVNDTPGGMLYYLEYTTLFNRLPAWAHWHGAVTAIAITLMSIWALRRDMLKGNATVLAALGLAPSGELYAISQLWRPMMLDRLLLPAGACLVGLWAAGFMKMNETAKRVALALFVPMLGLSIITYYGPGFRTDYADFTAVIGEEWQTGDAIYHNSLSSVVLLHGKLPDDGFILPGVGDLAQSLTEQTKTAMGIKDREMTISEIKALDYRRLWVLYLNTPMSTIEEIERIKAVIDSYPIIARYPVSEDQFVQFEIVLLDLESRYEAKIPRVSPVPETYKK